TGFMASDPIVIDFGPHYTITTTTASSNGTFSVTFLVSTQTFGSKNITVKAANYQNIPANYKYQLNAKVSLVNPNIGPVWTKMTIEGTGFNYVTALDVGLYFDNIYIDGKASSINGTVTFDYTLSANKPAGTKSIMIASGLLPFPWATSTFTVIGQITRVSPASGPPGTIVTVEGTGFGTQNDTIRIDFGSSQTITTGMAFLANDGQFSITFIVNTQGSGTKPITATGYTSNQQDITTGFTITGAVYRVYPTEGTVSTIVTVEGSGFQGSETVQIDFGNYQTITTATPNSNGTFSITFTVNTQSYGTKPITAKGMQSDTQGIEPNAFCIKQDIYFIYPTAGQVGDPVAIEGRGFSNDFLVDIYFGTCLIPVKNLVVPNLFGTFSTTFIVNTQPFGTTLVSAGDGIGTPSTTFNILPKIIRVNPNVGPPLNPITVEGTGYRGGSVGTEIIRIDYGANQTITTTVSTANGTFSVQFQLDIQAGVSGYNVITATGLGSTGWATDRYQVVAGIYFVTPTSGPVGTKVTVEGAGFYWNLSPPRTETVTLHFGTQMTVTTVAVNSNGTFSVTFLISTQPYAEKVVTADGDAKEKWGQADNVDTTVFFIKSNIILVAPPSGSVGTLITVAGTGFDDPSDASPDTLFIRFGYYPENIVSGWPVYPSGQESDVSSNGTFSRSFYVNTESYGTKVITAYKMA
ncbi:MAG: IPT/TIG domain-containing protein, partial [Candidatus Desantisbacteria bacterium]